MRSSLRVCVPDYGTYPPHERGPASALSRSPMRSWCRRDLDSRSLPNVRPRCIRKSQLLATDREIEQASLSRSHDLRSLVHPFEDEPSLATDFPKSIQRIRHETDEARTSALSRVSGTPGGRARSTGLDEDSGRSLGRRLSRERDGLESSRSSAMHDRYQDRTATFPAAPYIRRLATRSRPIATERAERQEEPRREDRRRPLVEMTHDTHQPRPRVRTIHEREASLARAGVASRNSPRTYEGARARTRRSCRLPARRQSSPQPSPRFVHCFFSP